MMENACVRNAHRSLEALEAERGVKVESPAAPCPGTAKMTSMNTLPLTYKEGNCFVNAFINKRNYYKDLNLKLMFGSLGMNDWFEYGGKDWKYADFAKNHKEGSFIWDAHCWLEDEEGNVYDYAFKWYDQVARKHTKKGLKHLGLIEKKSKEWCRKQGLSYVPADAETSKAIFLSAFQYLAGAEKTLMNGGAFWNGKGEEGMLALDFSKMSLIPANFLSICANHMHSVTVGEVH